MRYIIDAVTALGILGIAVIALWFATTPSVSVGCFVENGMGHVVTVIVYDGALGEVHAHRLEPGESKSVHFCSGDDSEKLKARVFGLVVLNEAAEVCYHQAIRGFELMDRDRIIIRLPAQDTGCFTRPACRNRTFEGRDRLLCCLEEVATAG